MIPVSLSLRNFLSYGEEVPALDFTAFRVACLSGDNGHGKSAILDAMTYALWGEARKSQHDRKPDDGLLRIGASEMRVEFCFELDEQRFRVLRSYRKRSSRGSAQLELQVYDQTDQVYRSLSEGDSLTRTQERINQLLSIDYETFVNSAFIVQGRADAFTEKNARQRKEILAQILGLERYDRLQALARSRFQTLDQRNRERTKRLAELDDELAESEQHARELAQVTQHLEQLVTAIDKRDADLETLRQKQLNLQSARETQQSGERERSELAQRLAQLAKERAHLEKQQRDDAELLKAEQDIQRDFSNYQKLQLQVVEFDRAMHALRDLETRRSDVRAHITTARHEVEQRLQTHAAQRDSYENQLGEIRTLLAKEDQVQQAFGELESLRKKLGLLEAQRVRHEALRHEHVQLEHAIAMQRQDIGNQRSHVEKQLAQLTAATAEEGTLRSQLQQLEGEVDSLQLQAAERDRLKERGSALRAQIDEQRKQLAEAQHTLETERQSTAEAKERAEDRCPLCGSALDEAHRKQLDEELERVEREQETRIAELATSADRLEEELTGMRSNYRSLEEYTAPLEGRRSALNECRIRLQQLDQQQREAQALTATITSLGDQLEQCAADERARLKQVETELATLSYRPADYARLQQRAEEMRQAELDHARLQNARAQANELMGQRDEANKKMEAAQQYLLDKLYAKAEQERLADLEREITALAYDGDAHARLRKDLDALSEVFTLQNNLQAARERRASTSEALNRTAQQVSELNERTNQLDQQLSDAQRTVAALSPVEQELAQLSQEQTAERQQRDALIERRGSLRTLCEREERLTKERDDMQRAMQGDRDDTWIYGSLDEAFGKDGIQALIIESAVPQIESEANALLARLTDNRIQISIESLRDLKTGGTRETLDIKIADELGERPYHLYSGGEAFRTNFALRIALSKVLAIRAGTQLRTLVIDEGFGTQDSAGIEQLVEAIQEVSRDFDKVLVVTHLPELKKVFPVQIEVVKHPDIGSRFTVIDNS